MSEERGREYDWLRRDIGVVILGAVIAVIAGAASEEFPIAQAFAIVGAWMILLSVLHIAYRLIRN